MTSTSRIGTMKGQVAALLCVGKYYWTLLKHGMMRCRSARGLGGAENVWYQIIGQWTHAYLPFIPPYFSTALLLLPSQTTVVKAQEATFPPALYTNENGYDCFANRDELFWAVAQLASDASPNSTSVVRYGPIEQWCVSNVTDFTGLFQQDQKFNSNIRYVYKS